MTQDDSRYRSLFELNPQVAWTADGEGRVLDFSERWLIWTGLDRAAALGDGWREVIHPDDLAPLIARWAQSVGTGAPLDIEHRIRRRDGSWRWVRSRGLAQRDAAGRVVQWYGYTEDIHERRQLAAELERQRRLLGSITDNARVSLFVMDDHQRCVFMNPAAEQMTGYTLAEVRDRVLHDVIHHTRPDGTRYPLAECPIDRAFPERMQQQGEEVFVHRSGRLYPVAFTASPMSEDGRVVGTVIEVRDVTEEKRSAGILRDLAEQRRQLLDAEQSARREAERVSRMKDEFLATLSHELRTPLNAIVGWSQLMKSGRLAAPELAQGVEVIDRNARAQAQLIDDLLDMNRIVSGKVRLDVQRVELSRVVDAAIESVVPTAEAKGVRLETVLDPHAGPVNGDPARLQQVVWNLLANAIKFTPRGGRVQVALERVNSHLEIVVSDTGQGIKPEFLPHVFERFTQADSSITRSHGGLGLGLSIVRQLVEMHNGRVRAKSAGEGQGATFIVALPLAIHQTADEDRQHPRAPGLAREAAYELPMLTGLRVLLVDDDADARDLMRRILEQAQATVGVAATARTALECVERDRPHVVLSDIGMPDMDGYQFIRLLRARPAAAGGATPAVAVTAFARSEDRRRALLAGYQSHLAKPLEPAELVAVVASVAGRNVPAAPAGG